MGSCSLGYPAIVQPRMSPASSRFQSVESDRECREEIVGASLSEVSVDSTEDAEDSDASVGDNLDSILVTLDPLSKITSGRPRQRLEVG